MKHEEKETLQDRFVDALLREEAREGDREDLLANVEKAIDRETSADPELQRRRKPLAGLAWAAVLLVSALGGWWLVAHRYDQPASGSPPMAMASEAPESLRASVRHELDLLEAELRAQEDLVEERRRALHTIVQAVGIPYYEDFRGSQIGESESEIFAVAQRQKYETEREKQQLEIQLKTLERLDDEELAQYAAGIQIPHNGVAQLYGQYQQEKRNLQALRAQGLGIEHPSVRAAEKTVGELKSDVDESVVVLRDVLQTQRDLVDGRLDEMAQVLNRSRDEAVDNALESQDYLEAKRAYEEAQGRLQEMKLRQSAQRINAKIQEGEPADAARSPAEPPAAPEPSFEPLPDSEAPAKPAKEAPPALDAEELEEAKRLEKEVSHLREMMRRKIVAAQRQADRERYRRLIDQPWNTPWKAPLSTFSVDVDTASYANVRRLLRNGQVVPPDAVRTEEMINYFDYRYEAPTEGGPFAVHVDLATCPWQAEHHLVKIGLKGREVNRETRPPSNLVFLIDVSGSMRPANKLPLLVESMKVLVEELDERDTVGIVVYAGAAGTVLEPTRVAGDGRVEILSALDNLSAGGSTAGAAGLRGAYGLAARHYRKGGVNRVILATDGDFNVGVTNDGALVDLVKEEARSGVFLSVLGFGEGNINDSMMEAITNEGNGNYFYIDSEREGRKVFLQQLSGTLVAIAKDVKIQVEFNPGKVAAYRLIGYANRILPPEAFNDDRVDAGDIGAGHTVTALYEVVPVGAELPRIGGVDPLKYQKPAGRQVAASPEWMSVKLRYKAPDGDQSSLLELPVERDPLPWREASADFRFAAGVALFGEKLRSSDKICDAPWQLVEELTREGVRHDPHGHRAEFRELVGLAGRVAVREPAIEAPVSRR